MRKNEKAAFLRKRDAVVQMAKRWRHTNGIEACERADRNLIGAVDALRDYKVKLARKYGWEHVEDEVGRGP